MLLFQRKDHPHYRQDKSILALSLVLAAGLYMASQYSSDNNVRCLAANMAVHAYSIWATENPFFRAGSIGGVVARIFATPQISIGLSLGAVIGSTLEAASQLEHDPIFRAHF